jgi:hypothetical protein
LTNIVENNTMQASIAALFRQQQADKDAANRRLEQLEADKDEHERQLKQLKADKDEHERQLEQLKAAKDEHERQLAAHAEAWADLRARDQAEAEHHRILRSSTVGYRFKQGLSGLPHCTVLIKATVVDGHRYKRVLTDLSQATKADLVCP